MKSNNVYLDFITWFVLNYAISSKWMPKEKKHLKVNLPQIRIFPQNPGFLDPNVLWNLYKENILQGIPEKCCRFCVNTLVLLRSRINNLCFHNIEFIVVILSIIDFLSCNWIPKYEYCLVTRLGQISWRYLSINVYSIEIYSIYSICCRL